MTLNDAYETLEAYRNWIKGVTNEAVNLKRVDMAISMILSAHKSAEMTIAIPRVNNDYYSA